MSASPGKASASARNAGSSVSLLAIAPARSVSSSGNSGCLPPRHWREADHQRVGEQRVERLPARERVAVVARQEGALVLRLLDADSVIGAEKPRLSDSDGRSLDVAEAHDMAALADMDDAVLDGGAVDMAIVDVLAVAADQAEGQRDVHQPLAAFRRRRRHRLLDLDDVFVRLLVVRGGHRQVRRAGLMVPERELREVAAGHVLEHFQEILDRRGLAVMALEIEVHAFAERLRAEMVRIMRTTSEPFS